ncbi:hypothetical protein ACTIVE_1752 [Actinomadura verrucosospora]|uniref:Uncharacterized protein n=1 Tax=Actinomadura verrucosospora TaxID=46165 RepID=A0A7D3VUP3_ACTVE|nr:hypothetical protein ACTIVE_1752 [Actinomadura verrucosospora]
MMVGASILPEGGTGAFWIVVVALGGGSILGFVQHACALKMWRTRTFLDAYFDRRRKKLVDAYLGGGGGKLEDSALFTQFPAAVGCGLWFAGALFLQYSASRNIGLLGWLAVICWLAGFIPIFIAWRRSRVGPPERIKPQWLIEEERRRESAGEIMRYGGGWVRTHSQK